MSTRRASTSTAATGSTPTPAMQALQRHLSTTSLPRSSSFSNTAPGIQSAVDASQTSTGSSSTVLEQKMSHKVSELTQVVHLLFVKCQEKELQSSVLQKELQDLKTSTQTQLTQKDVALQNAQRQLAALQHEHNRLINAHQIAEGKWHAAETRIRELQELVTAKEHELHDFQSKHFATQASQSEEVKQLRDEAHSWKEKSDLLTVQLKELTHQTTAFKAEMEEKVSLHIKAKQRLQSLLEIDRGALEESQTKTQQLEAEIRNYQRELRKLRDSMAAFRSQQQTMHQQPPIVYEDPVAVSEEVQRLKEELLRYKLELFNRDNNFNRIFTDKRHPLQSQPAANSGTQQQQGVLLIDTKAGRLNSVMSTAAPPTTPTAGLDGLVLLDEAVRAAHHPVGPVPKTASTQPPQRQYQHSGTARTNSSYSVARGSGQYPLTSLQREKSFSYVSGQAFDEERNAMIQLTSSGGPISLSNRPLLSSNSTNKLPHVNRILQRSMESPLAKQRLF